MRYPASVKNTTTASNAIKPAAVVNDTECAWAKTLPPALVNASPCAPEIWPATMEVSPIVPDACSNRSNDKAGRECDGSAEHARRDDAEQGDA